MKDAPKFLHAIRRQVERHQLQQLRVAVLLDHINVIVRIDERGEFIVKRIRAQAEVRRLEVGFLAKLVAALADGPVRRAVANQARLGAGHGFDLGLGDESARRLELARQPVHIVHVVVRPLAVLALRVVPRSARERRRHAVARDGAVRDAVAVDILVAAPLSQFLYHLGGEQLPAVDRLVGILEALGHPVVHPEVQVHHDEDRRLELFGEVERLLRHGVALLDRGGDDHDVLGVAVGEKRRHENVTLRRPRRQTGGRPDTLHVEDDGRRFRVIGQAHELRHQ